ncbi:MAG: hypothetical protein U0176_22705 [Bacteroidia bacterium]
MSLTGIKHDDYEARFQKRIADLTPQAKKLKSLNLRNLGMNWGYGGDFYQKELAPFFHVEEIDLHGNYIDGLIINLSRFYNLKRLDLSFNAYWYWGAYGDLDLARELPCPKLERLDLSSNMIGVVLLRGTAFRDSLLSLDLSGCHFHSPRLEDEREHPVLRLDRFSKLQVLKLADNLLQHVPNLAFLPTLEELNLSLNPMRSGHDLLESLPRLEAPLSQLHPTLACTKDLAPTDRTGRAGFAVQQHSLEEIHRLQRSLPQTRIEFTDPTATSRRIP